MTRLQSKTWHKEVGFFVVLAAHFAIQHYLLFEYFSDGEEPNFEGSILITMFTSFLLSIFIRCLFFKERHKDGKSCKEMPSNFEIKRKYSLPITLGIALFLSFLNAQNSPESPAEAFVIAILVIGVYGSAIIQVLYDENFMGS